MSLSRIARYEIEKEIGRGAMAVVYKATDTLIGRTVAIKTIRLEHGSGMDASELRTRLYREARSAGVLNHPNIVTIYDIGEEGENAFIAMEFVDGETLESWLAAHPIPPLERTISIVEQIASGLDYAGSKGIIHRDIKPGNILMTEDLRPKIADFGIAKLALSKLTMTGTVMGTPSYMSPEQAMGKELDGRSDIFSLGVIFYQMLTGERPFVGTNPTTIIYKILHEQPIPPRSLNVTLHPGFDFIVGRMLAKDPAGRYQSCAEVVTDLKNYETLGRPAVPSVPDASAQPAAGKDTAPAMGPRRARAGLMFAVALLVLAAAAAPSLYRIAKDRLLPPSVLNAGIGVIEQEPPRPPSKTVEAPPQIDRPVKLQEPGRTAEPPGKEPEQSQTQPQASAPTADPAAAQRVKPNPQPVAAAPGRVAYVSLEEAAPYALTVFDGTRKVGVIGTDAEPMEVTAGEHRFRIVAEEVFLDRPLQRITLKPDQEFAINAPGLGSAYIEVPDDAYEGCAILFNGRKLPGPYPAQVPKVAAGEHRVQFRWTTGPYRGKTAASQVTVQEDHHYLIKGEPAGQVTIQQVR